MGKPLTTLKPEQVDPQREAGEPRAGSVAVVGSINVDFVVPVERLPLAGETVLGRDCQRYPGGKGANQAVAAARLGANVAFVGRVGDDDLGDTVAAAVKNAGVDVSRLYRTPDTPTGLAMITVTETGDNTITVSPGANHRLTVADIAAARGVLVDATVVLCQLEIPIDTVVAAAECATGTVILNPAPATALPAKLLERVDVLVPNRSELARLADAAEPATLEEAVRLATRLADRAAVVVTLGAEGALLVREGEAIHIPTVPVDVVDTTGAGDTFCGALAEALARGCDLDASVRWAVRAAAIATTRYGAQTAMPTRGELDAFPRRPPSATPANDGPVPR